MKIVGLGEFAAIKQTGGSLKTYGLGSCVALVIIDHSLKAVGMAHVALPESLYNKSRAASLPGYFADMAVPALVKKMQSLGCKIGSNNKNISVKLAGGAQAIDNGIFKIGDRNIAKIKELLAKYNLEPEAEDVGGKGISRTVEVWVDDGRTEVTYGGRKIVKLL